MAVNVKTTHGVNLRTRIVNDLGREIATASKGSPGLSQRVEATWLYATRSGDVRITSAVIHNPDVLDHSSGSPWTVVFHNIIGSTPRSGSEGLEVSPTRGGQAVIDCGTIGVLDVWTGDWVVETLPAQLTLTVA